MALHSGGRHGIGRTPRHMTVRALSGAWRQALATFAEGVVILAQGTSGAATKRRVIRE